KYEYGTEGYEFDTQEPIRALNLYSDIYNSNKRIIAAKVTTEAVLSGNLDATETPVSGTGTDVDELDDLETDAVDAEGDAVTDGDGIPDDGTANIDPHFTVPINVYDVLGNEYKITLKLWKNYVYEGDPEADPAIPPQTSWYYVIDGGANATATEENSGYIKFDSKGRILNASGFETIREVTLTPHPSTGAESFEFKLNMEQLSMYADDSSVKATRVDGYPPGTLVTFSIGGDGIITGVYDNGRQQPLGQVALATFENPAGLQKVGSNQFSQTTNSGDFKIAAQPGNDGAGVLIPGTLEMSNVDLAKQFTEMIITQRGFQANSRVMTTSDEILQELSNIKR
ncbi:MAG: flagellar hook-basal body complex protein, partial [Clostridiaceae bacterium]|nr:flagellar hook-basal body complex protein [Clostridiaceae bacterium]